MSIGLVTKVAEDANQFYRGRLAHRLQSREAVLWENEGINAGRGGERRHSGCVVKRRETWVRRKVGGGRVSGLEQE